MPEDTSDEIGISCFNHEGSMKEVWRKYGGGMKDN